jgi:hypothetical protein
VDGVDLVDGMDLVEGVDLMDDPLGPLRPCSSLTQSATASAVAQRLAISSSRRGSSRLHGFNRCWRK